MSLVMSSDCLSAVLGLPSVRACSKRRLSDWVNWAYWLQQRSGKNSGIVCVNAVRMWFVITVKWEQSEAFFVYGKRRLIHPNTFLMHIYYQLSWRTFTASLTDPTVIFIRLTFIICKWRYDTVQQWALCVFFATCQGTLACCRMVGNMDGLCVGTLKDRIISTVCTVSTWKTGWYQSRSDSNMSTRHAGIGTESLVPAGLSII